MPFRAYQLPGADRKSFDGCQMQPLQAHGMAMGGWRAASWLGTWDRLCLTTTLQCNPWIMGGKNIVSMDKPNLCGRTRVMVQKKSMRPSRLPGSRQAMIPLSSCIREGEVKQELPRRGGGAKW